MFTFSKLGDELYWGRLGNQMWEIASTIGIATKNNQEYVFPEWKYNKYFKVGIPTTSENLNLPVYQYDNLEYRDIYIPGGGDLRGYFQSYKYFEHCKKEIFRVFDPMGELFVEEIPRVAIHVRRGDYLDRSNFHTNLGISYYLEAMSLFPGYEFTFFSDDIEWCKENFGDHPSYLFPTPGNDIFDLFYMASHRHQIIANSSFSYWGAYLNHNISKLVIYPKRWYNFDCSGIEICPREWNGI